MTNQNVFDLALRAVLGAALLVSPAYAATKPAISSIRLAAPAAGHIIARTPALTFSCSTATIAVNTVGRCGPVPAATINGSSSADAFTQPVRLNEANTFRCASSVVGAKTTDPLCAAKATVNRGFSADTLTKGSLRLNPPILVRCPPISIVPRPTPPWCTVRSQVPIPVTLRASKPVSTLAAPHVDPPHSLGLTLQFRERFPATLLDDRSVNAYGSQSIRRSR